QFDGLRARGARLPFGKNTDGIAPLAPQAGTIIQDEGTRASSRDADTKALHHIVVENPAPFGRPRKHFHDGVGAPSAHDTCPSGIPCVTGPGGWHFRVRTMSADRCTLYLHLVSGDVNEMSGIATAAQWLICPWRHLLVAPRACGIALEET